VLRDGATQIGRGDLGQTLDVRTGDEAEELAREFNAMAAQLRSLYQGMETTIAERTEQLQRALDDLRLAHASLGDSERRYSDIVENASDLIQVTDAHGRIVSANRRETTLLGVATEAIQGRDFFEFVAADLREATRRAFNHVLAGNALQAFESALAVGTHRVPVEISATPVLEGDVPVGVRAILRDVADRKVMEARLIKAERLSSVGALAAGVAHEINNPAAFVLANIEALTGHLRLLQEKVRELPEPVVAGLGLPEVLFEATAILQESKEGMARIHRIVRDLGSFSHVDDDAAATLDVNGAVESALTMLRNEIKYRARIERDLRSTQAVRANQARLGQVFLNIILNAAQALDETASKRNVVRVRSFDDGEFVVVEVEDNGPGISSEVAPRIFDSFFTTKPRGIGTGLGLPISLGIIRSLGGQLTVDSRPGEGATFRVRLPAVEAVPSTVMPPSDVTPAPREFVKRRVLAIDDEPLLLKAYRRMLSDIHAIDTALGGLEALRALERDASYDVILCDLQMPEMSGMGLHEAVRKRWPALADRFVFVTGGAFSPDAKRFLEESVCAVIQKPFRVEDLLALIERKAREGGGASTAPPSAPSAPAGWPS